MIDTLEANIGKINSAKPYERLNLNQGGYLFITLHRPFNVDTSESLKEILKLSVKISRNLPVVFSMHPRTAGRVEAFELGTMEEEAPNLHTIEPVLYCESLAFI